MNKEMQKILIDIFPLIVEVNFNTDYRANINIQPTFENFYQVWYQVTNDNDHYKYTRTAFWDNEPEFRDRIAYFKNELLKILGRD